MATQVAQAYVQIVPSLKGIKNALTAGLGGEVGKAGDTAGKTIGEHITGGLGSALKGVGGVAGKALGAVATVGKAGAVAVGGLTAAVAGLAATGGVSRALQIEQAQAKLTGLGHSTAEVSGIMSDALASVKGTAYGLGDAASVAATMVASGIKPGQQLASVLKTIGDTATISGRSFEDVGAIFSSVAARGKLQGDDMLQLTSAGVPVLQALSKQLGKSTADVSEMVSKGQVDFQTFADAMSASLGGSALASGQTFSGALDNVKAALSRLGAAAATPALAALKDVFDAAIPAIDGLTASLQPAIDRLGTAMAAAGKNAAGALQGLGDGFSSVAGWAKTFFAAFGETSGLDGLGGLLGSVSARVAALGGAIASVIPDAQTAGGIAGSVFASLKAGADALAPAFQAAATWVSSFVANLDATGLLQALGAAAVSAAGAVGSLASAFVRAIPPTALTAALNALIVPLTWLGDHQGVVTAALYAIAGGLMFNGVSSALGAVVGGLKSLPGILQGVATAAGGVASTASNVSAFFSLLKEGEGLGETLSTLGGGLGIVKNGLGALSSIGGAVTGVLGAIGSAFSALGAVIAANPLGALLTVIALVVTGLTLFFTKTEAGRALWASISAFFQSVWTNLQTAFQTVFGAIGAFFSTTWTNIQTVFSTVWNAISAVVMPIVSALGEFFYDFGIVVAAVFVTLWRGVQSVFETVWNAISAFVTPIVTAIGGTIEGVFNAVASWWSGVWDGISAVITTVWDAIIGFIAPIVARIGGTIHGVIDPIANWWSGVWNGLKTTFTSVWDGLKNAAETAVTNVVDKVKGIKDKVLDCFKNAGTWLKDVGGDILTGMWDGISDKFNWLKDQIGSICGNVVSWAKQVLGIGSPSKVMRDEVGKWIPAGMAIGISQGRTGVRLATEGLMDEVAGVATPDIGVEWSGVGRGTALRVAEPAMASAGGAGIVLNYNQYSEAGLTAERQLTDAAQRAKAILLGI